MGVIIAKANLKISDIPEEKIYTSDKTGHKYLPVTIVINDELNQFGRQGPVFIEQTKDERENKVPKKYLGDVTVVFTDGVDLLTTKELAENEG